MKTNSELEVELKDVEIRCKVELLAAWKALVQHKEEIAELKVSNSSLKTIVASLDRRITELENRLV